MQLGRLCRQYLLDRGYQNPRHVQIDDFQHQFSHYHRRRRKAGMLNSDLDNGCWRMIQRDLDSMELEALASVLEDFPRPGTGDYRRQSDRFIVVFGAHDADSSESSADATVV